MEKPESFEVTEYNDVKEPYQTFQVLKQIVKDYKDEHPVSTHSWKADFIGDVMKVTVATYEMFLPQRMREVQDMTSKYQKEVLSHLKKEFKRRTGSALSVKEVKDRADYTTQKVSMNERYMFTCWCVYTLDV